LNALIQSAIEYLQRGGYLLGPIFVCGWLGWVFLLERFHFLRCEEAKIKKSAAFGVGMNLLLFNAYAACHYYRHHRSLAFFAAICPLLGLLGTVTGMVRTFAAMTRFGSGNPAFLSQGISEALITTQCGLIAAFPLVVGLSFLRNRTTKVLTVARARIHAQGGL
jgi:biopolymer transport protein ExbB